MTYDLIENRYHFIIRRADGTQVFRLLRKDKKLAEEIFYNLLNGIRWGEPDTFATETKQPAAMR